MLSREYLYVYPYKYQDRFNRMYKDNQDVVRRFLSGDYWTVYAPEAILDGLERSDLEIFFNTPRRVVVWWEHSWWVFYCTRAYASSMPGAYTEWESCLHWINERKMMSSSRFSSHEFDDHTIIITRYWCKRHCFHPIKSAWFSCYVRDERMIPLKWIWCLFNTFHRMSFTWFSLGVFDVRIIEMTVFWCE